MKEFKVTFNVQGTVSQVIQVPDDFTAEQVEKALTKGNLSTSIQEGGEVIQVSSGLEPIGKVISVDNNCEYDNFEVTNPEEEE